MFKFKRELKIIIVTLLIISTLYFSMIVFPDLMGGSSFEMFVGIIIMTGIVIIWSNLIIELVLKLKLKRGKK